MKARRYILAVLVLFTALASGCHRRPLEDVEDKLWLNLVIDLNVKNLEGEITPPEIMHAIFYDPNTMIKVADDYVQSTGGLVNIQPGKYKLLVYNFDTESTLVRNEYYVPSIEAYTNDIPTSTKSSVLTKLAASSTKADGSSLVAPDPNTPIVYEPDHLWVARQDVEIFRRTGTQTIEADATTVVETYYLGIRLLNKQNLVSAQALLSGQVKSNRIGMEDGKSTEDVTLYFNMHAGVRNGVDVLETKFNTFGKLPNSESRLWLTIVVTNTDGTTDSWQADITDEFVDNPDKYIYIETPQVVVPESTTQSGGGFTPEVEEWEDVNVDITI